MSQAINIWFDCSCPATWSLIPNKNVIQWPCKTSCWSDYSHPGKRKLQKLEKYTTIAS